MTPVSEPASSGDLRALLLDYLDFYRSVVAAKIAGLDEDALQETRVPSGWTSAGLLNHLAHMEQRWLHWGFRAEPVPEPWGDASGEGWVSPRLDAEELIDRLERVGRHTREIVQAHDLSDVAAVGGRFERADDAPQLHWILLHVLQEYARHAGHLDVSRELMDGAVGEGP